MSNEEAFQIAFRNVKEGLARAAMRERLVRRIETMPSTLRFPAEGMQVEFVADVSRGPEFDLRHNFLLRTNEVVTALLSRQKERMRPVMEAIQANGGFFEVYDGICAKRLQDHLDWKNPQEGGWLMAETSGCPVTSETGYVRGPRVIGGDGHFQIPPDRRLTYDEHDIPLPIGSKDIVIEGDQIIQEIVSDPACAMLIADICSLPGTHRMGFAAVTEDVAISEAAKLNPDRQHPLKYVVAAITSIKGLVDKNKNDLIEPLETGWLNVPSIVMHTRRAAFSGTVLGKQVNRYVPVELPAGDPGALRVDRYITVQNISGVRPRPDVRVVGGKS